MAKNDVEILSRDSPLRVRVVPLRGRKYVVKLQWKENRAFKGGIELTREEVTRILRASLR